MKRSSLCLSKATPAVDADASCFAAAILALVRVERANEATALFGAMLGDGVPRDDACYAAADEAL